MKICTYVRVSLDDKGQSVENQVHAIHQAGYKPDFVFREEGVSGTIKALARKEFAKMAKVLEKDDLLVVTAIDRLGRDAEDILNTVNTMQKKGVKICVLQFGNTDITSTMGKLLVTMIAALAEMERNNISERTKQAMARLKSEGKYLGGKITIKPADLELMIQDRPTMSLDKLSAKYGYDRMTINNNIKQWQGKIPEYTNRYNQAKKVFN